MNMTGISKILLFLAVILLVSCNIAVPPASPFLAVELSASSTPAPIISPASEQTASPLVLAYFTGTEESLASLQTHVAYLDILSVDVFNLRDDGSVYQFDDLDAPRIAQENGLEVYACVSNYRGDPLYDFDPDLARAAILTYREQVIDQLVEIALEDVYTGINIDLEDIAFSDDIEADRAAFSGFVEELSSRLHSQGKKLIISVPAKSADLSDDDWAYPYDLAVLGQAADYLQLMTYDQHGPWGKPGPLAGLDWTADCTAYAASQMDPARLLVGLPAYAYDWDLTESDEGTGNYSVEDLYWTDIPALLGKSGVLLERDGIAQSPWAAYIENGHEHMVWYEDAESIRAKAQLVSQYNLGGLSVWALGQEDESFWRAVLSGLK